MKSGSHSTRSCCSTCHPIGRPGFGGSVQTSWTRSTLGWRRTHPTRRSSSVAGSEGQQDTRKRMRSLGPLGSASRASAVRQPLSGEAARKAAYLAVSRAIVLFELGRGTPVDRLAKDWKLETLEGKEERWRDDMLWLATGLASILEVRAFYHHSEGALCRGAGANPSREAPPPGHSTPGARTTRGARVLLASGPRTEEHSEDKRAKWATSIGRTDDSKARGGWNSVAARAP